MAEALFLKIGTMRLTSEQAKGERWISAKVSGLSLPGASRSHFLDMSLSRSHLTPPSLELNPVDIARNIHTTSCQEAQSGT